jgi:hypothetical protein
LPRCERSAACIAASEPGSFSHKATQLARVAPSSSNFSKNSSTQQQCDAHRSPPRIGRSIPTEQILWPAIRSASSARARLREAVAPCLKYIFHFTFSSEVAQTAGRVLAIVAQPTQIGPSLREPSNASARGARTRGSRTHGSRTGGSRTSTLGCRRKPRRSSNDMRQGSSVRHSNA